jgi:hypothetical protein
MAGAVLTQLKLAPHASDAVFWIGLVCLLCGIGGLTLFYIELRGT